VNIRSLFEVRAGAVVASSDALADYMGVDHGSVLERLQKTIASAPPSRAEQNFIRVDQSIAIAGNGFSSNVSGYFYYLTHTGFSVGMGAFAPKELSHALITCMNEFSDWHDKLRALQERFVLLCPSLTIAKGQIQVLDELEAVDTACLKAIGMMFDPKQTSDYSMAKPRLIQKSNTYYVERDGGANIPVAQSVVQAYIQPHADAINSGFVKEFEGYDVDAINAQMIEAIKAETGVDISTMSHEEVLALMQRLHAQDRTTH
jgi:hypothetical protein